jgi:hypothetical protein
MNVTVAAPAGEVNPAMPQRGELTKPDPFAYQVFVEILLLIAW